MEYLWNASHTRPAGTAKLNLQYLFALRNLQLILAVCTHLDCKAQTRFVLNDNETGSGTHEEATGHRIDQAKLVANT